MTNEATTATTMPTMLPATSFAATTRRRSGVIRNVGVAVLWRNSPAIIEMPMSSTSRLPADAADITPRSPALLVRGAVSAPVVMDSATLTGMKASVVAT